MFFCLFLNQTSSENDGQPRELLSDIKDVSEGVVRKVVPGMTWELCLAIFSLPARIIPGL